MLTEVHVNTTSIKTKTTKNRHDGSNKRLTKKKTTTKLTRTNTVRQALHQHVVRETMAKQQQGRKNKSHPIQAATTILPKNAALVLSLAPRLSNDHPDKENPHSKQWYTHQVKPNSNPATWKSSTINGSVHETTTTTTQNTEAAAAAAAVIVDEVLAMLPPPPTTTRCIGNGTNTMISKMLFPASTVVSSKKKPLSSWYELCHYDNQQQQQQRAGRRYQENFKNHAEDENDTAERTPTTEAGSEATAVEGSETLSTDNTMTSRPVSAVVSSNIPMVNDDVEPIHPTEENDVVLVPIETTESDEGGVDRPTTTTTTKTTTSMTMPDIEAAAVDVDGATQQRDEAGVVVVPAIVASAPTEIVAAVTVVPDATTPTPTTPAPTPRTSATASKITISNGTNHDNISTFLSPTTANFLTRPLLCTHPSRSSNTNSQCHSNFQDDTNINNAGLYYDDDNDNGAGDGSVGYREDENKQGTKETYECFGFSWYTWW